MAREIQIPFGPDKTNGAGIEPIASDSAAAPDPLAAPPVEAYADTGSAAASAPVVPAMTPQMIEPAEESDSDTMSDEEAIAQGLDPMQMSIAALRDSIGQGRELKAREKELDELNEAISADNAELDDRDYILANYNQVVAEQDAIIADRTAQRDARKNELAQFSAQLEETTAALERMREYHATQLQPLETDLGHARAVADRAKNDERSRKGELSAAENELRRANDNDANTMAIAQHQQTQAAYDEARRVSEQAKSQLANVQRAYDDARAQADQAESPLKTQIEDLTNRVERLKTEINQLGEEISTASKRRQYCDTVYQYPEETARMHAEVAEAERVASKMSSDNEVLRGQLAVSRRKSKKAKIAIAIVIVLVIVIVAAFIIVGQR
ncbi:MAG: hypothetical protein IJ087_18635 [Eggerthellaceae bacterium]|nr:hypothetical protein [Eggerthellaceae bacterium]